MVRFGRALPLSGIREGHPARVRDVLAERTRASAVVGARTLRDSPGARGARAAAVGSMILQHASQALDEELAAALLRGLLRAVELHGELVDAAARSREEPTVSQRVELASVDTVDAKSSAGFSVLVDHVVRAVGVASVTVAFGPADLGVQIRNGNVTGFDAQQSVTATLELEELRVDGSAVLPQPCTLAEGRRSTDWRAAPLARPIPLEATARPHRRG